MKAAVPGQLRRHPRTATAALATLSIGAITALALLGSGKPSPTAIDPRTRVYANYSACLLTDAHGTSQPPASEVWAGMQQATASTNERVRTLPVTGTQTLAVTETFINTLALQGCNLVVVVGTLPTKAAIARAAAYPSTRFLLVETTESLETSGNVASIEVSGQAATTQNVASALANDYSTHAAR